jgi:tetratricopeptide (TPR) repeat protein
MNLNNYLQSNKVSPLVIYLFLFIICFSVYFNALNNEFIFDDNLLIVKNGSVRNLSLIKIFKTDVGNAPLKSIVPFSAYYRPFLVLSFAFDHLFWKLNPLGYRLVNIVIQSINSFLIYLLIYLIFKDKAISLLSAALFCLHPIHVSLVTFIAGRASLQEALFMLLSLITFTYYSKKQKKAYYILSLMLFISALLSRESAMLLPLLILLCAIALNIDKKKIVIYLIPYMLICVFYIGLRTKFILFDRAEVINMLSLKSLSGFVSLLQKYLEQLILPVWFQVILFGRNIICRSVLFLISFIIIVYSYFKAVIFKERVIIFALAFYFVGLLPIIKLLGPINTLGEILSEHYVYIASIGFFVFIAFLILKLSARFRKIALICLIFIVSIYSIMVIIDNGNYKDDVIFYKHILTVNKNCSFIYLNLGTLFSTKKMYEEAIEQANSLLAFEPNSAAAYLLLANVFKDKGDLYKAAELYKKVLNIYPEDSVALNNLGLVYKAQGKDEDALANFKRAVELNPQAIWALENLTDFILEKKLYGELILVYEKILMFNPNDAGLRVKIGITLAEANLFKEAEAAFKEALKLNPNSIEALRNLGALYGNMGDFNKAISLWEKALTVKPDDEEIKKNLKKARELLNK